MKRNIAIAVPQCLHKAGASSCLLRHDITVLITDITQVQAYFGTYLTMSKSHGWSVYTAKAAVRYCDIPTGVTICTREQQYTLDQTARSRKTPCDLLTYLLLLAFCLWLTVAENTLLQLLMFQKQIIKRTGSNHSALSPGTLTLCVQHTIPSCRLCNLPSWNDVLRPACVR